MKKCFLSIPLLFFGCVAEKPAADKAVLSGKKFQCQNNLSQLWMLHLTLLSKEKETGGEFWLQTKSSLPELYECPLEGTPNVGDTDYRGPASNVDRIPSRDPVGACLGNHPDGTGFVLKKSGQISEVREGDPLYKEALLKTAK